MGLVGRLVGREARVAVDAVHRVLGRQAYQGVVVFHHLVNQRLREGLEVGLDGQPAVLMVVEPRAVVVDGQFLQEGQGVGVQLCGHIV